MPRRLQHPRNPAHAGLSGPSEVLDRLGRNYADVTETIREFMRRGVVVKTIINAMTFDGATKDPVQMAVRDALIGFMAATAQAQAEATKEAQMVEERFALLRGGLGR